jgi:beta-N-acetylhexosaminidase
MALADPDVMIGQMVMTGFRGLDVQSGSPVVRDIAERHVGAVVLFDYDASQDIPVMNVDSPEQLRALDDALQSYAAIPLLIGIDQEGGTVNRLKEERGFPPSRSANELGMLNDLSRTREYAEWTAGALARAGISINFAPVVDLNLNPDNPIIGRRFRSYSADPDIVTAHAIEVIRAHHRYGVLTTLKHFPGHGSSAHDTHLQFVDVTSSWRGTELDPYRTIISEGMCDSVMTAHVFHGGLDPDFPATLSKKIITGILREQIGFDGVVISDDMQMRAISSNFGLETAVYRAIEAGVDILSFGNNMMNEPMIVERAIGIIKTLLRQGDLTQDRIEESYGRVIALKKRLGGISPPES